MVDRGHVREDCTAKELNARQGEMLLGSRTLNGWIWCERSGGSESGWISLACLQEASR